MQLHGSIENIILGVAANGLTSIIGTMFRRGKSLFGRSDIAGTQIDRQSLSNAISVSCQSTLGKIGGIGMPVTRMAEMATSPEFEGISRQVLSMQLAGESLTNYADGVDGELKSLITMYMPDTSLNRDDLAGHLREVLIVACDALVSAAIERGLLVAHESRSISRHRVILAELQAIKKALERVSTSDLGIDIVNEFEHTYRAQVVVRHGYITPPHFDVARRVPINDIYVTADLIRHKDRRGERVIASDVMRHAFRTVILGNPGGGKSTFAQKLCHDIAMNYDYRLLGGRRLSPVLVVLRDYGIARKEKAFSIVDFMESIINMKYVMRPKQGLIRYLLDAGRLLVVFDGLDELIESSYRSEIVADIEALCALYSTTPVVVTSREIGYEAAPLGRDVFDVYRLAPFSIEQSTEYTSKWFGADADLSQSEQREKASAFMTDSGGLDDLRSNPLMLALMCNIYRGENYIPKNRPEVYEKCATMMFERWDKSRGILVSLPFEAHIRPAMQYLASWIYSDESLHGGVPERVLVAKAAEYLKSWRFEDADEASSAAQEFIGFCRGRAWVFTETGSSKGEGLFQFTHRTFLEYFAAAHIVRRNPSSESLLQLLRPRIAKGEWDMVAQLAFQMLNRNIEGAAEELLESLLPSMSCSSGDWNAVSFAARCLKFMVPKPATVRRIAASAISLCGEYLMRYLDCDFDYLVSPLLTCAEENVGTARDAVARQIAVMAASTDDNVAIAGLCLGEIVVHMDDERPFDDEWELSLDVAAQEHHRGSVESLLRQSFFLALARYQRRNAVAVSSLIEWFGPEGLFKASGIQGSNFMYISVAQSLWGSLRESDPPEEWAIAQLAEIGESLLRRDMPWLELTIDSEPAPFRLDEVPMPVVDIIPNLNGDSSFGLLCLCMVSAEYEDRRKSAGGGRRYRKVHRLVRLMIDARRTGQWPIEIAPLSLSERQLGVIAAWIAKATSATVPTTTLPDQVREP